MENENFNSIPLLYMLGRLHQSEDGGRLLHPLQTALQSWMAPKLSLQLLFLLRRRIRSLVAVNRIIIWRWQQMSM